MCGLAGFIQRDGSAADPGRLAAMAAVLSHRGPDDQGLEVRGPVALGHRRLSIVDLSAAGHQPMPGPDESTLIAYNGEVYNFRALRELIGPGPEYRGGSDTEVVARVLATRGASGLGLLNGIFALAWLDLARGELLLARDQFGIKPLYFAEDGERFYFASEVKAILAGGLTASAEPLAPLDFAYTGWTADERTFLRGVRRLPPGSFLRYELASGRWSVERYFSPTPNVERARPLGERYEAWKDAVRSQLEWTIEAQLMSDVPVGTFCSGGIDSSLVTAMAAKRHGKMLAFNVTCPDSPALDEGPYARAVARHVGVELRTLELTRESFRRALVRTVWVTEYPLAFVNTVPLALVSHLARDGGVRVLLSGEGADETFGGYVGMFRRLALRRVAESYGVLGRRALEAADRLTGVLGRRLGHRPPVVAAAAGMHDVLTGGLRLARVRESSARAITDVAGAAAGGVEAEIAAELLTQLQSYILPILHRTDRASMAASVEARVPFLDPDLVGLVLAMPTRFKVGVRGLRPVGKAILKDIAAEFLPREIVHRPKMGFAMPPMYYVGAWPEPWLERGYIVEAYGVSPGDLRAWVAVAGDQTAAWLLTLEIWGQLFVRGRSVGEVEGEFLERG